MAGLSKASRAQGESLNGAQHIMEVAKGISTKTQEQLHKAGWQT